MTGAPRAVLSWSSGKDCAYALHVCRQGGLAQIEALLTTVNETHDRVAMHGTRGALLRAQAAALGLPLIEVALPWPCPNKEYEARMAQATARGITHIVFGDLFLEDIRRYREDRLAGSGLTPLFPLWGRPTTPLAKAMLSDGIEARIVTCDPARVPQALAGQVWDKDLIEALPAGVDPCGENGEFHTVVTMAPGFCGPIAHEVGETVVCDGYVYADVIPLS
ncbi:Dph6-related ATP pyrophosphatase [Tropicibacter oceani]|uniref:ATP-binding protein n=1 Tax=Tropicibacter oceani TaxID=3058420 RepID=A0ABY8QDZ5_9RHOB|nr:ATP-binding protein [Tropicibacter oceani]WGW02223.1 ATP-binding protein [Tropicibacter oceani]